MTTFVQPQHLDMDTIDEILLDNQAAPQRDLHLLPSENVSREIDQPNLLLSQNK